jgi:hypothetical protein
LAKPPGRDLCRRCTGKVLDGRCHERRESGPMCGPRGAPDGPYGTGLQTLWNASTFALYVGHTVPSEGAGPGADFLALIDVRQTSTGLPDPVLVRIKGLDGRSPTYERSESQESIEAFRG